MSEMWIEPSREQQEQALLAQNENIEVINRLVREGIDGRVDLAGLGSAAADTVTCLFGPRAVAAWFATQANIVVSLQQGN
jgi:hypothetical protein